MRISWCAIAVINLLWCAFLWKERRLNHRWLLPFFSVYFISDTSMLFASPTNVGGFGLFGPGLFGWEAWVFVASLTWMSWFAIPIWAACKLMYGRIPWWSLWPAIAYCVALSGSEILGLSTSHRRFAMHVVSEPIMLVVAMAMIGRYVLRQIHKGEPIDFLGYAVALTSMMLLLKLGLMLNAVGLLKRWQSHVFYYLYMATLIGAYFGHKRLRRWLLFR